MKAVLVVGIFLLAGVSALLRIGGDQYYVTSDGEQLSCAEGATSPGIGHRSFSVISSKQSGMYTCDVVAPTDAAYRSTAKYPLAPPNAKQSNSFVIGSFDLNVMWICQRMVSGIEARLQADSQLIAFKDPRTNSGIICQKQTAET